MIRNYRMDLLDFFAMVGYNKQSSIRMDLRNGATHDYF